MKITRKVAAGLGGLALMLGTIGGTAAVIAAPPTTTPPAITRPAQVAPTETMDAAETPIAPATVKITAAGAKTTALAQYPARPS